MMKPIFLACLLTSALASGAQATEWKILPESSTLTLTGEYFFDFGAGAQAQKTTVSLPAYEADISFDPKNLAESRIHIVIDLMNAKGASQNVTDELQGAEWFNVAKSREAVFESGYITFKGDNAYEAMGKLTMNGVTKDVVLPFEAVVGPDEATAKGSAVVMRSDFGIGTTTDAKTVAYEVTVSFDIKATALTN